MSEFQAIRAVVARKEHRCLDCYRTINPGETYHRSAGTFWGEFWYWKCCTHCQSLHNIVCEIDHDRVYNGDGFNLREWVFEYGVSPAEVHEIDSVNALAVYRWSRWFEGRWVDSGGNLRPIPALPTTTEAVPTGAASLIQEDS